MEREELLYALNEAIEERQLNTSDRDVTIVETAINILNEDAETLASYNESEQLTILEAAVEVLTEADKIDKYKHALYVDYDNLDPIFKTKVEWNDWSPEGREKYNRRLQELREINYEVARKKKLIDKLMDERWNLRVEWEDWSPEGREEYNRRLKELTDKINEAQLYVKNNTYKSNKPAHFISWGDVEKLIDKKSTQH